MSDLADSINAILMSDDIEGFIALGAPRDEYDFEARQIADLVRDSILSEEEISKIIAAVWMSSFGLDDTDLEKRLPAIKIAARKIVNSV